MRWGSPGPLAIPISFPGLSYPVFRGVMKKGYKVPTPIQRKVRGERADGVGRRGTSDSALLSGLWTAAPRASCHICRPSYCEAPQAWPLHRQGKLGPARWRLDPGPLCYLRPLTDLLAGSSHVPCYHPRPVIAVLRHLAERETFLWGPREED